LAVKAAAPRANVEPPAAKPKRTGVTAQELESCDAPVALPEPDAPFRKKAKKTAGIDPAPEPDDATEGPAEAPFVELVEVEAPPDVKEQPPPGPPPPNHLEVVSSSDEFQNLGAHPIP
jgi:hypothetical protein